MRDLLSRRGLAAFSMMTLLTTAGAGCADDGGGDPGAPPTVSNLALTPETVTAGSLVTLSGTMRFSDPDGDVALLVSELELPGGATQPGPETPVAGAAGITTGDVPFQLALQTSAPGALTVRVWLVDTKGNPSNTLEAVVTVE